MVKDVKTKKKSKKEGARQRRANGDKILNWAFSSLISICLFFALVILFRLLERGSVSLFYFITPEFFMLLGTVLLITYITDIIGNVVSYGIVWCLYMGFRSEGTIRSFWDLNKMSIEKGLTNFFTKLFSSIVIITGALIAIGNQFLPEVTLATTILIYVGFRIFSKALSITLVKSFL